MNINYDQACDYYAELGYDMASLLEAYRGAVEIGEIKTFEDWLINDAMESAYCTDNDC